MEQNIKVCSKKDANKCRTQGGPELCDIDSQSVKTTLASEERGIDGGKKQKEENDILCSGMYAFC